MKKLISIGMAISILGMASGCSGRASDIDIPSINNIELGVDYLDIKTKIDVLTFRTDIMDKLQAYAKDFNNLYPGIQVNYIGVSDYETTAITYLSSGIDWGDVMMIPLGIEKDMAAENFQTLGLATDLSKIYNYTSAWTYHDNVYGIASTGNANGVIYNKKVFKEAGIEHLPKTPEEFLVALHLIKSNTNAIPLYTNYADEWPMSCWDAYIGVSATGSSTYLYHDMVQMNAPFVANDAQTGPYYVYKILYDAVAEGLTEDDYTTTSEAQCYQMINDGEIGCMVFASWAVTQAMSAGSHPDDIGYMAFPMSIGENSYVSISGDYSYGIRKQSSYVDKIASLLFIKYMTEISDFTYSEGGLSVVKNGANMSFYSFLDKCIIAEESEFIPGERLIFERINAESGLLFNANGNSKGQSIVEHAYLGDKAFNEIMEDWNKEWRNAKKRLGIA